MDGSFVASSILREERVHGYSLPSPPDDPAMSENKNRNVQDDIMYEYPNREQLEELFEDRLDSDHDDDR